MTFKKYDMAIRINKKGWWIFMEAGGFLEQGSPPSIIKLYKEWSEKPPGSTFLLSYKHSLWLNDRSSPRPHFSP